MEALRIFQKYLPTSTVIYCHQLWQEYRFKFIISPKRQTKLGDYRFNAKLGHHIVTVNGNLNPYSFLTTYLHEVAHLVTFKKFGNKVLPHGSEWKNEFKQLFAPLLDNSILPNEVIVKLKSYLRNPRASSCSEQGFFEINSTTILKNGETILKNVFKGDTFFLNKKQFIKLSRRRTRILCEDVSTKKKYLINENAVVKLVQGS